MHLVVDAVAVRSGSAGIVVEHLLDGWTQLPHDDRITVLAGPEGLAFTPPADATVVTLDTGLPGAAGKAWLRSGAVRRAARRLRADAVLEGVPAAGLAGARVPRGVILYDLRHELRPHQFSRATRVARRVSWAWSMERADAIFTISERTRSDLADLHPRWAGRASAAVLGSDHAERWPQPAPDPAAPYALAFGHFANKNADAVVEGWARFCESDDRWRLRLVGMGAADRAAATAEVERLGLSHRITLMPWLDDAEFARCFVDAGLVIFPSDFEGFGLPAAEALRLGIPTVISEDPALLEVTGGHAVVAAGVSPEALAEAYHTAIATTPEQRRAGREFAEAFTWRRTAEVVRRGLAQR
ncbi:MAG TPA: glycosyltransferase [Nocardioides sp.]|nr:glycosyltransferase [Nocardioides sp.]